MHQVLHAVDMTAVSVQPSSSLLFGLDLPLSATQQSPKPHREAASAPASQLRSDSLPLLRVPEDVQTSTQKRSMLHLSAILPCQ